MASRPCLHGLGPSPLMSISEILFFASKNKEQARRTQVPMPEAYPPPLSDTLMQAASVELPQGGCAALQSCILAWRDKKITAAELVNFCRSMSSQSAAFRSVFGSLVEPSLLSASSVSAQELRQAPAFLFMDPQDCNSPHNSRFFDEPVQPCQDSRAVKRQRSFATDMAAEALISLMNPSVSLPPTPPFQHQQDFRPANALASFPGAPVLLPSIHALLGNGNSPSPPSFQPMTAGSAPPSPPALVCKRTFAKSCKSGASKAKEAAPSAKEKKPRVQSPLENDDKSSPIEAVEAASSEEGSGHNKYCHFCQHIKVKRASSMQACENPGCNRRFCEHCLKTHISQEASDSQCDAWHCPICRKTCCCTMRECTKEHRHCKAYRYRRKRARQAQGDKDAAAASAVRALQGAGLQRNPAQALTAMQYAFKPFRGF